MHGIQWLADVDVEVRGGIRGAILTFIICFIATSTMDERGQINNGTSIPHSTFSLGETKEKDYI